MSRPLLRSEVRAGTGKSHLKVIRSEGYVPGTVYGHNKESKNVCFPRKELERLLGKYGVGASVELLIGDEVRHAIIKDIHRHIIKQHVLHIDLQELDASEKVKVKIPLHLTNKAVVESSVSVVQHQITELEIQTYPKHLPQMIEVDASSIKFGEPMRIKDLAVYADVNIEVLHDPEEIVALIASASKDVVVEEVSEEEKLRKLY